MISWRLRLSLKKIKKFKLLTSSKKTTLAEENKRTLCARFLAHYQNKQGDYKCNQFVFRTQHQNFNPIHTRDALGKITTRIDF